MVCAFKSLATLKCRKAGLAGALFHHSFHDHIIRSIEDYEEIWKYIDSNPDKWVEDTLYSE